MLLVPVKGDPRGSRQQNGSDQNINTEYTDSNVFTGNEVNKDLTVKTE